MTGDHLVPVMTHDEPKQLSDHEGRRNGADERRADTPPREPNCSASVAGPLKYCLVCGLRELDIRRPRLAPDLVGTPRGREGVDVDPEEVLRSTAQARFNHAVEPNVLDSLAGQGVVNSDECHRWLPRADPEIRPEISALRSWS